jgi:pilus assembly protein TadC
MARRKEELASALREILKVDIVFEKLTVEELEKLLEAIKKLVEKIAEETETEKEDRGPLGFGVLPTLREQIRRLVPEVRKEVRKTIDEFFDKLRKES